MTLWIVMMFSLVTAVLIFQVLFRIIFRHSMVVDQRAEFYIGTVEEEKKSTKKEISSSVVNVTERAKQIIEKQLSKEAKSELDKKLRDAGVSYKWTAVDFRLIQILVTLILIFAGWILAGGAEASFSSGLLMGGALGALGFYYPNFYLSVKKRKRMEEVQRTLADFFDMINLSIEAGMGLDAAIFRACQQTKGPLSVEFKKAIDEMRLGKSRREAFTNLRNRVPVEEFQSIMTSIIQADQLGIGMAKALRSLTVRIREHQRQLAREKAMKAPVKMLFPMVFFIFPSMFIVILGPVVVYFLVNGLS
ncbi:hypothetical protein GCM10010954_23460 [Halobacillus andaensis]|uniref:Type II secretion system protein GspF domain-containing protein n=1 Tax=Halobacillus andaensis TaxID=1176239 RepID=A0A917B6D0_HALAA|nr:type II secretion system F family protein [Halobacillus andaensis]MBP2006063.1 tight adherence protein C [Halobacillus andaensis]GGF23875.1 hypothetical protein GCM10010954_23460 [Halobacillus andaensis]